MDLRAIPLELYTKILPNLNLTVLELLQFHLPLLLPFRDLNFPTTDSFFDTQPPNTTDVADIQELPSPLQAVIDALKKDILQAISSGKHSIKPIHTISKSSNKTYPLWILTYWDMAFNVRLVQRAWARAEQNLHELSRKWAAKGKTESTCIIDQVFNTFTILQWEHDLQGFSTNGTSDNLDMLTAYTSNMLRVDFA